MVILGVADRDRVAGRQPQRLERDVQSAGLAHALWRGHHPPAVENQDEGQFERPNDVEEPWALIGISIDQALSRGERNPAPAQFGEEAFGYGRGERRDPTAVRKMNHGAVFGDDSIDEMQVTRNPSQFFEDPASDQQHDDTARAGGGNRVPHRGVQNVAPSHGAVVVQSDH